MVARVLFGFVVTAMVAQEAMPGELAELARKVEAALPPHVGTCVMAIDHGKLVFEHASGLTAGFVAAGNVDRPSAYGHHEIVRIVQESLLNVHRHSAARQVLVRLAEKADHWELSVEDDGRGFDFEGRLTQEELDRIGKGPRIVKQRVRLLGGSLTIESSPGAGVCVRVDVPG